MAANRKLAGSLFSGAGIGDVGFRAAGINFKVMCESEYDRKELLSLNFQEAKVFNGDINENYSEIIKYSIAYSKTNRSDFFLISCTAPCQGMSKSGQGTLLRNIRLGKRPKLDPRNKLIVPALEIITAICPTFVVFENVCEMGNTLIEDNEGELRLILNIINESLRKDYYGRAYDVEFADYGIPQRRKRLITVYSKDSNAIKYFKQGIPFIPVPTYSKEGKNEKKPWISVAEALKDFPPLDAINEIKAVNNKIPFHRVPVLDSKKYEWIKYAPPGKSAFDNQCINPKCSFQGNRTHGSLKDDVGINRARKDTPLYCEKCGELLPRPFTLKKDGSIRIMSGYTSAYKRMDRNLPSPALTRNFSYPCSDSKVHPFENRVISIAEAFVLQTISQYPYRWGPIRNKKGQRLEAAPDTLIRLVIGESIPPRFTQLLGEHLIKLTQDNSDFKVPSRQLALLT